jgi:sulfur carrier protein
MAVTVTINGKPRQIEADQTVRQLIEQLGLGNQAVAVEVNREVVPRREHAAAVLREGDVVELVTLVGGG